MGQEERGSCGRERGSRHRWGGPRSRYVEARECVLQACREPRSRTARVSEQQRDTLSIQQFQPGRLQKCRGTVLYALSGLPVHQRRDKPLRWRTLAPGCQTRLCNEKRDRRRKRSSSQIRQSSLRTAVERRFDQRILPGQETAKPGCARSERLEVVCWLPEG